MSEMIDRVARALCDVQATSAWRRLEESGGSIPTRDDFREAARAAIEAMREPTEAMREEAILMCGEWHGDAVISVFPDIIAAALKD